MTTDRYELARIIRDANCLDVTNGKYDDLLDVEDFLPEADAVLASAWLKERLAATALPVEHNFEYGVEYEVSSTESIFTPAHSEKQARKWVEESPTDTGLRARVPAGPWFEVHG